MRLRSDRVFGGSQYLPRPSSADDKDRRRLKKQRSYCIQISKAEYEKEAEEMSNKAVRDLLVSVMTDDRLTEKERSKRLKQVRSLFVGGSCQITDLCVYC